MGRMKELLLLREELDNPIIIELFENEVDLVVDDESEFGDQEN